MPRQRLLIGTPMWPRDCVGWTGCSLRTEGEDVMDLTSCPECGHLAEVQWREVFDSTDGPVEHARIMCVQRHWFLLPVASLPGPPAAQPAPRSRQAEIR